MLVDAAGRVGAGGHLFDGEAETLVATTPAAPAAAVDAWKAAGAEVLICEHGRARRRSGVDLDDLARALGERGVLELLVEGGPRLQASLWAAGLADRLVWYLAPLAIGGQGAPGAAGRGRGGHPGRRPPAAPGLGRPPRRRPASGGVSRCCRARKDLMFTGIVEGTGTVAALAVAADGSGARLEIEAPCLAGDLRLGESVAVNGCCLTVAEATAAGFAADLVAETLRRTALGGLAAGDRVNLERPMALGGRLGGHLVQGHVDGVGQGPATGPPAGRGRGGHGSSCPPTWSATWSRRGRSRSTGSA